MKYEELVEIAKTINETTIDKAQELLDNYEDDKITVVMVMVAWSLKKSIEAHVGEDNVSKVWEKCEKKLFFEADR